VTAPSIVWFRQDLRVRDQAALTAACAEGPVVPVYVLDDERPGDWRIGGAQRWWLHHSLAALQKDVPGLVLRRGDSVGELAKLAAERGATRIHAVRHYEPWWQDAESELAADHDLVLHNGNRLLPPEALLTGGGTRYRMFTPWWRALLEHMPPAKPLTEPAIGTVTPFRSDRLEDWGLLPTKPDWAGGFADWTPGEEGARQALRDFLPSIRPYDTARNLPSQPGTSRISPHLHFGEISPATVWHVAAKEAGKGAEPFLREIGWRDYAANLIDQFPAYGERNGKPAYDRFPWRTGAKADADFTAWTKGRTGYPIVDAGMRELWATGWMHNRVRMIAASFLIKHLLIDWRRGERWFWDALVDADYPNNAANWQWVAGTGLDAPLFSRIMAPLSQSEKFDAAGYIRKWVPELAGLSDAHIHDPEELGGRPAAYPPKIIGHRPARERALAAMRETRDDGA
jgi:deoxyribodipyrimidine photo-lyase